MESSKTEIQKQVEYYLSDLNLKQDEFFHSIISKSESHSIPIESLLNCNKIKKLGATKDQIIEAIKSSSQIEVTGDNTGVKRRGEHTLPEFEPKTVKKVKGENGTSKSHAVETKEEVKGFEPKIFKFTLSKTDDIRWDKIQTEIQNATGAKIGYTRFHGTEGHFAVDENTLTDELKNKILNTPVKIGETDVKIEDCLGQDLSKFYADHGGHLDMCLERSGLKKRGKGKGKDRKNDKKEGKPEKPTDDVDFIFSNKRYKSLTPLKQVFKTILQKTDDDEPIKEGDHQLLLELLKYHESGEEKSKDLKHFTVGQHPLYKQTRCFFVVRNDGTKEDFSSTKCIDNIRAKHAVAQ